jgi:hypothetical protein
MTTTGASRSGNKAAHRVGTATLECQFGEFVCFSYFKQGFDQIAKRLLFFGLETAPQAVRTFIGRRCYQPFKSSQLPEPVRCENSVTPPRHTRGPLHRDGHRGTRTSPTADATDERIGSRLTLGHCGTRYVPGFDPAVHALHGAKGGSEHGGVLRHLSRATLSGASPHATRRLRTPP